MREALLGVRSAVIPRTESQVLREGCWRISLERRRWCGAQVTSSGLWMDFDILPVTRWDPGPPEVNEKSTTSPSKTQECMLLSDIYYKEGQAAHLLFSTEFSYDFWGFPIVWLWLLSPSASLQGMFSLWCVGCWLINVVLMEYGS